MARLCNSPVLLYALWSVNPTSQQFGVWDYLKTMIKILFMPKFIALCLFSLQNKNSTKVAEFALWTTGHAWVTWFEWAINSSQFFLNRFYLLFTEIKIVVYQIIAIYLYWSLSVIGNFSRSVGIGRNFQSKNIWLLVRPSPLVLPCWALGFCSFLGSFVIIVLNSFLTYFII